SIATGIPVREDILIRTKKTKTQTKKAKLDRWKNMEGVFRVPATIDITGKRILVVDDVVTTGSTISSACLELEERGACALGILAIATGK
ncbi:MAG: phosphoribosyltransferase family protein, partial [Cyclobacteriaceae bacterium]|nr:phosphoribosyltransferase family protein [Cyclobacteriaceae bacterium]